MPINEAQILQQLHSNGVGTNPKETYTNVLTDLADEIVKSYKDVLDKTTKSDAGVLKQSITVIPSKNGFDIEADFYFKFIDDGVAGVGQFSGGMSPKRAVVQNSPYRFRNLGVPKLMAQSIREWSGAPIQQAYAIGVNIKRYGIKPQNISDKAISDKLLERMSLDLATITGLAIEVVFDKVFENLK